VASADFNNDGKNEIITGAGPGGGPHVRVFDSSGHILSEFFAYAPGFRGGVFVAAGDIDGDNEVEIITGAGPGGGPHVRVFDQYGNVESQFFAFNEKYRGGVVVASGNVNGIGVDEIITGVASDGLPQINIFNKDGDLLYNYFAFEADFYKGITLSATDIDGDKIDDVIAGKAVGGLPEIKILDQTGRVKKQFLVHSQTYKGGARAVFIR